MAMFNAIFVHMEGLEQREVGPERELAAETREAAISEAAILWRPAGANCLKVTLDGQSAHRTMLSSSQRAQP